MPTLDELYGPGSGQQARNGAWLRGKGVEGDGGTLVWSL